MKRTDGVGFEEFDRAVRAKLTEQENKHFSDNTDVSECYSIDMTVDETVTELKGMYKEFCEEFPASC